MRAGSRLKVAVNLSPRQFDQKDLVPMMQRCIESGDRSGCLELEITETALMSREVEVDALMHAIRALGVELSIDDFGTGYSSLAALKRFPVQRLKIDRAFIRDLGRDEDSAAIVRSIVNLARNLKLAVVAEGVETEEQLAILRGLACDDYQGFLFSRPIEAGVVPALGDAGGARRGVARLVAAARVDERDADAERFHFIEQRFRQRFQRGARGVAEALERGRLHGGPRQHHDVAGAARAHAGQHAAGQVDRAEHVFLEQRAHGVLLAFLDRARVALRCARRQHVDAPETPLGGNDGLVDAGGVRHVQRERQRAVRMAVDEGPQLRRRARGEDGMLARRQHGLRQRGREAGGGVGDEPDGLRGLRHRSSLLHAESQ
jgi:hypothetical protein